MLANMDATRIVDPKLTEEFLLTQDGVLDASVWFDQGQLRAHVTLAPAVRLDAHRLGDLCAATVGPEHTPREFVVVGKPGS
jgi:hypothetical protein